MLNPFEAVENIEVTEFHTESAEKFHNKLMRKSMIDPIQPIVVYINSYGGSADALSSMIGSMEQVPNKIITVARGCAMSCGAILLSAGDFRFCDKNARVMIHEVSGAVFGDTHNITVGAQEMSRLNKYWLGFFAKNCGFSGYEEFRKVLKEQDGGEIWFTADKAKKFGLVDFVGLPVVRPFVLFDIGCVSYVRNPQQGLMDPNAIPGMPEAAPVKKAKKKAKKKVTKKKVAKKLTKKKVAKKKVKKVSAPLPVTDPLKALQDLLPSLMPGGGGEITVAGGQRERQ